jgi:hypothetical protein
MCLTPKFISLRIRDVLLKDFAAGLIIDFNVSPCITLTSREIGYGAGDNSSELCRGDHATSLEKNSAIKSSNHGLSTHTLKAFGSSASAAGVRRKHPGEKRQLC